MNIEDLAISSLTGIAVGVSLWSSLDMEIPISIIICLLWIILYNQIQEFMFKEAGKT